jgi:hypothetical protein
LSLDESLLQKDLGGGATPAPSRYCCMRAMFVRGLALTYLAAFASLAVQLDGLIGSNGILPAREFLEAVRPLLGRRRYLQLPTVFWLDGSDRALHLVCWGGIVAGAIGAVGLLPRVCLIFLWLGYLSLMVVGQPFLGYQWDTLLLETGLLGILFAPGNLWLGRARREPSPGVVFLLRWLLFRLMFESGVVKLTSGDPTWRAWQALAYHYETQPLPPWTSWYMHQLPPWFQRVSIGIMFWAELVAPWFVFGPRALRVVGLSSLALLQLLIAATGNYGFFNVLSLVLCLTLVEDRDWSRLGRWMGCDRDRDEPSPPPRPRGGWRRLALGLAGAIIVSVTTMQGLDRTGATVVFPAPLETVREWVEPFHSLNAYGLFAVMTTERPEIVVEGSDDGETWAPYAFRWKPGDLDRRPRFTTPHMPRLDWQMWFAALAGDCRSQTWFLAFERRILEGSPEVLGLLQSDPFPAHPPRYLRASLYQYHFTGRGATTWWRREPAGLFCPPVRL